MKNTGIRFTITRLHSFSQIEAMIRTMAGALPQALKEEGMTLDQIYKAFKLPLPEEELLNRSVTSLIQQRLSLRVEMHKSIREMNKKEWNRIFEGRGTFDADGLDLLEHAFTNAGAPEDDWVFDYIIIRDNEGKIILANFLHLDTMERRYAFSGLHIQAGGGREKRIHIISPARYSPRVLYLRKGSIYL